MRTWLRQLRQTKGLTLEALAKRIGTSKHVLSGWELSTKDPGRDMTFLLADELGEEVLRRFGQEARAKQTGQVA